MTLINVALMKNPLNWLIILFMLFIFGIAADVVLRNFSTPSTTGK